MKTKKLLGLGSWVLGLGWLTLSVFGQGTPIATTATTRALLRATNSADFRLQLGFLSTNNTVITNYVGNGASITNLNADELRSGTVPLARLSGITATQIANDTLTTNKVDSTFYNLLTNTASGGSSLQTGNATDAANINLTVTGTLVAATQTNTTLSVGSAYFGYTNVGATFSAEGKLVGTNGVTQAGLAAGSYAINGALLTNAAYANVYNVEKYGADHNIATTNDHFAIQAAIDAATNTGGGTIFFPPGNYYINGHSYNTNFCSESQPACIVLWSNCSWNLQGHGANLVLRSDTSGNSFNGVYVVFGSGDSVANIPPGSNPGAVNWAGAEEIHFEGFTVEGGGTAITWMYDFTEFYRCGIVTFSKMRWKNGYGIGTADAVDCQADILTVSDCYFTNWTGSVFHPTTTDGVSEMRDCYIVNCNATPTANQMFDTSAGNLKTLVENCTFTNVMNIGWLTAGTTIFNNCSFYMTNHAGVTPRTNLLVTAGSMNMMNCSFIYTGTANTIGVIVGSSSAASIGVYRSFFNMAAVWTTNLATLKLIENNFTAQSDVLRLGGTSVNSYEIKNNLFDNAGSGTQLIDTTSSANNVIFSGNTLKGSAVTASGTNWIFSDNTFSAGAPGSTYLRDSASGNCTFINNVTMSIGNLTSGIRLQGPTNYISGNRMGILRGISSAVQRNIIINNVFGSTNFDSGSTEALMKNGVYLNNYGYNSQAW